jgi:hypothetical protein
MSDQEGPDNAEAGTSASPHHRHHQHEYNNSKSDQEVISR